MGRAVPDWLIYILGCSTAGKNYSIIGDTNLAIISTVKIKEEIDRNPININIIAVIQYHCSIGCYIDPVIGEGTPDITVFKCIAEIIRTA